MSSQRGTNPRLGATQMGCNSIRAPFFNPAEPCQFGQIDALSLPVVLVSFRCR